MTVDDSVQGREIYKKLMKLAPYLGTTQSMAFGNLARHGMRIQLDVLDRDGQQMVMALTQTRRTHVSGSKHISFQVVVNFAGRWAKAVSYLSSDLLRGEPIESSFDTVSADVNVDSLFNRLLDRLLSLGFEMEAYA
ncbi:hypothetical protein [Ottowia sp.]|uniref:hypothetical protein n=1 Tax=Ottowia sp. TaxID=1898956 RepID=UPI002B8DD52F|nr:hypothetical protein [Ottowia sp.]HPZ57489.1 hypothetical protein [Ottowia sp.]HQD48141.1 hypothetical protein [Ottowia sp.]